jgi:hypothetical protein
MLNLIFDLESTLIESIEANDNAYINNIKGVDFFHIVVKPKKDNTQRKKSKNVKKSKKSKKSKSKKVKMTNKLNFIIFTRAYLNLFLRFCFKNFNVGFWTNGTVRYMNEILKKILLPEELKKCICLVGRSKKGKDGMHYKDVKNNRKFKIKKTNDNYSKKLEFIYNKKINKHNTLLFDDRLYNKGMNYNNTVLIPTYKYNIDNDKCLFILMELLNKIKRNKTINRVNIKSFEDKLFKDYPKNKYIN